MRTYILIDAFNTAFRAKHVIHRGTLDDKVGLAFHIIFNSVNKIWKLSHADHAVFCFEGRSWRKDIYSGYKANRQVLQAKKTEREQEEDKKFLESVNEFKTFLESKTNVTVLQSGQLEADDFIALWIQEHPDDNHIIVSSDSDFYQLLAPNVKIYDGINERMISINGVVDDYGRPVLDKKTKQPLPKPDPEWLLFEKCIRGDVSDNIFSAYPGARTKSTKKMIGIRDAFEDRDNGGFNYNNFMLQRYVDDKGIEHRVRDRYLENKKLIDLSEQPTEIKDLGRMVIQAQTNAERKSGVGIQFLKFCGTWRLDKLSQYPDEFAQMLNKSYNK
jgi:hypothetical protein